MKTVSINDAQKNWPALLEQVKTEPVAVQRQDGKPAILLSFEEYERLTGSTSTSA